MFSRADLIAGFDPELAKAIADVPEPDAVAGGLIYEPKWDGFRVIVFKDGDDVELGSRGSKTLTRYFPELVDAARAHLPERCVVDGEIVVRGPGGGARSTRTSSRASDRPQGHANSITARTR